MLTVMSAILVFHEHLHPFIHLAHYKLARTVGMRGTLNITMLRFLKISS